MEFAYTYMVIPTLAIKNFLPWQENADAKQALLNLHWQNDNLHQ